MDLNTRTLNFIHLHMRVEASNLEDDANWKTCEALKTADVFVEPPKWLEATIQQKKKLEDARKWATS